MTETNVTHVEVFQGAGSLWYWHGKAANNEIVTQSEGYDTEGNARRAAADVFPDAELTVRKGV
jgi:uncharacterized protein YegP (UPF0339 family)